MIYTGSQNVTTGAITLGGATGSQLSSSTTTVSGSISYSTSEVTSFADIQFSDANGNVISTTPVFAPVLQLACEGCDDTD